MLLGETTAAYCQNHTEQIYIHCEGKMWSVAVLTQWEHTYTVAQNTCYIFLVYILLTELLGIVRPL